MTNETNTNDAQHKKCCCKQSGCCLCNAIKGFFAKLFGKKECCSNKAANTEGCCRDQKSDNTPTQSDGHCGCGCNHHHKK